MEILVFKFEGPISNNEENINFSLLHRDAPVKKMFYLISLIYMEILVFKFERPISNNKENKVFASHLRTPLAIFYFYFSD